MSQLAEVVTLYEANARSIPDMLRQAAANIETEVDEGFARTVAMVAVQITENGGVKVYGWGETGDIHAMGALALGMQEIGNIVLDTGSDE